MPSSTRRLKKADRNMDFPFLNQVRAYEGDAYHSFIIIHNPFTAGRVGRGNGVMRGRGVGD
jgi:hypothetical protein